jgi:hypothetical protein
MRKSHSEEMEKRMDREPFKLDDEIFQKMLDCLSATFKSLDETDFRDQRKVIRDLMKRLLPERKIEKILEGVLVEAHDEITGNILIGMTA